MPCPTRRQEISVLAESESELESVGLDVRGSDCPSVEHNCVPYDRKAKTGTFGPVAVLFRDTVEAFEYVGKMFRGHALPVVGIDELHHIP